MRGLRRSPPLRPCRSLLTILFATRKLANVLAIRLQQLLRIVAEVDILVFHDHPFHDGRIHQPPNFLLHGEMRTDRLETSPAALPQRLSLRFSIAHRSRRESQFARCAPRIAFFFRLRRIAQITCFSGLFYFTSTSARSHYPSWPCKFHKRREENFTKMVIQTQRPRCTPLRSGSLDWPGEWSRNGFGRS